MEKLFDKTIRKFTSRMQARLLLVFCIITLLLVGLMGRLVYIVQVDGDRYSKHVLSRQTYVSSVLPFKRGDILDRNGTVLAHSELRYRLIMDPKLLLQNTDCINPTMDALKKNFEMDDSSLQDILDKKPDSQYYIVKKNIKYDDVQKFNEQKAQNSKIAGVWFEEEYVRNYPFNTLACDILGFTSADNTGFWGIEEYYNKELNGTNGREYGYYDSELDIERIVKKAVNGNSVVSTIDANVQRILQEQILQFNSEIGSKGIGVLIMNPNNGEILGMASNQEYNLNKPRDLSNVYTEAELASMTDEQKTEALNKLWKNDIISFGFEPGSTFKPVTVAAALEENLVSENSTFVCDGGEQVGNNFIHCSNRAGHGELTLTQALMLSCNDSLMQIANREKKRIFKQYQDSFNFGLKTGIDLPGEENGIVISEKNMGDVDLATNSFGQNFTATMIQMASAYSSLVNGGYYYQPHIVKQIVNDSGATVKEFDKQLVRQTVSMKTSEFIQQAMYQTVETGTAKGAKVEGYSIGGKTGTAQKQPRAAKTYIVSFLGEAPAVNPQIVIYVMVDEPQNVVKQADSSIATKFASRILNQVLPVLGIFPDGDIDYLLPTQAPVDPNATGNTPAGNNNQTGDNSGNNEGAQTAGTEDTENSEDTQTAGAEDTENSEDTQTAGTGNNEDTQTTGDDNNPDGQTEGDDNAGNSPGDTENSESSEFNPDALD